MSNSKKSPSILMEALIDEISPPSRNKRVRLAIEEHFRDSAQHDGRGRRTSEIENACRALRHLKSMPGWQVNERYDLNMRNRIRDILKHVDHGQSWSETIKECSEARGLISKSARRRSDRREYGFSAPRRLDDEFICYPLNSAAKLRSAGKRGKNCLGSNSYNHVAELKSGETEFYEIKTKRGAPRAFLSVDKASRMISEIGGINNGEVTLPTGTLWAICRELDANGDDCDVFVYTGVLSALRDANWNLIAPMRRIFDFDIWWKSDEIVLKDLRNRKWSRFEWDDDRGEWNAPYFSEIDAQAFALMLRCQPEFEAIAEKVRPIDCGVTQSISDSRRRHRRRRGLPF